MAQAPNVVTPDNAYVGATVVRSPIWPHEWGDDDIHPNAGAIGTIRAWSDMSGARHGEEPDKSSSQLQWEGLVIVHWSAETESNSWKSVQAYRIGFGGEVCLCIRAA